MLQRLLEGGFYKMKNNHIKKYNKNAILDLRSKEENSREASSQSGFESALTLPNIKVISNTLLAGGPKKF